METDEFAPAKINLTLHVTGQRADGYHSLDSLVVFTDIGDTVSLRPGIGASLTVTGPFAGHLPVSDDNLVLQAARLMGGGVALTLTKRLPIASGIGGGSADAAATLRLIARIFDRQVPDAAAVLALGADVPVCLAGHPARMTGVGEGRDAIPDIPRLDILLVNPGIALSTPAVFAALEHRSNPPMPKDLPKWSDAADLCRWLALQRNDLQAPAIRLAPQIGQALGLIRDTGCLFAGMSGSGATCFGLYPPDGHSAKAARADMFVKRPSWWAAHGQIS